MANFTATDVKRLRDQTGAGMMDCKNALAEADDLAGVADEQAAATDEATAGTEVSE